MADKRNAPSITESATPLQDAAADRGTPMVRDSDFSEPDAPAPAPPMWRVTLARVYAPNVVSFTEHRIVADTETEAVATLARLTDVDVDTLNVFSVERVEIDSP